MFSLWLIDHTNNSIRFGKFESIDACRAMWCEVARHAGCDLYGFRVQDDSSQDMVYEGHYGTDEC
jgi:hypothetical protein